MRKDKGTLNYLTGQFMQVTLLVTLFLALLFFGVSKGLATATLITTLLHQGLVVIVWRYVLFHPIRDRGHRRRVVLAFGSLFFLFFASRLIITILASVRDAGSLEWSPWIRLPAMFAILLPGGWALYSVFRYFGVYRALGADHFDPQYRTLPFERRGIYRYTSNGMYTFAVLLFLLPGLAMDARAGLLIGLYHYGAVWIHYHATEKPDLAFLHGDQPGFTES